MRDGGPGRRGDPALLPPVHADLVEVNPAAATRIAALPFVRWVGPYHPAYRMFAQDRGALEDFEEPAVWNLVASRSHDLEAKRRIADDLAQKGGRPFFPVVRESFLLTMVLPPAALRAAIFHDEVLWVDRWSPPSPDMDIVRASCGANAMATIVPGGFQGQGVRGEIMDIGCQDTHVDLAGLVWHSATTGISSHGTSTYAIAFGKGIGDPQGLGLLPQGQGFAGVVYDAFFATNRYGYTAELLGPSYECVFQSNSTGSGWSTAYTSISMLMDQIIFDLDLSILQSQSNQGGQQSRPESWAKNVVSVGGMYHYDTLTRSDDAWATARASARPRTEGSSPTSAASTTRSSPRRWDRTPPTPRSSTGRARRRRSSPAASASLSRCGRRGCSARRIRRDRVRATPARLDREGARHQQREPVCVQRRRRRPHARAPGLGNAGSRQDL